MMLTALAKAERSTSYSGLRFPLSRPSRIGYAYCYTRFGFAYWTTLNVEVCGVSLTGPLTAVLRDLAIDTMPETSRLLPVHDVPLYNAE